MVVQRTLAKIEELKERPHHERHAIARISAIGFAALLIVVWGYFAVRSIGHTAVLLTQQQDAAQNAPDVIVQDSSQTASAAGAVEDTPTVPTGPAASSTNGYVDLMGPAETGQ